MFLPEWIYRMLPILYLAVGLIVASKMDSFLGTASGVLLGVAGLIIWKMRLDYRRETAGIERREKAPSRRRHRVA